jgi:hypothetical protein
LIYLFEFSSAHLEVALGFAVHIASGMARRGAHRKSNGEGTDLNQNDGKMSWQNFE